MFTRKIRLFLKERLRFSWFVPASFVSKKIWPINRPFSCISLARGLSLVMSHLNQRLKSENLLLVAEVAEHFFLGLAINFSMELSKSCVSCS